MCEHFGQEAGSKTVVTLPSTRPGEKGKVVEMKRPAMLVSINREGRFTIPYSARRSYGQCGAEGATQYKYFVTIQASNTGLTSDGYVMENQYVDDYFQEEYTRNENPDAVSCEDMAQRAVEHFIARFYGDPELMLVEVQRIYVRIHGSDISFIEAEWKK